MKKCGILLIFVLSIIVNVYFGYQKSGFHEDEYYTYYSSNRSVGLYQPDREWQDRQTILDEFVVKNGEGFNYGLVALVQSWDVHPPFYYMIFHTICSLFPGVFTKWTGIITNLIAFSLTFLVLDLILKRLRVSFLMEMLGLLFYGFNPQTISGNMLTRMYAWLSFFVALCAYLHIRLVQDYKSMKTLNVSEHKETQKVSFAGALKEYGMYILPVVVTSYLGFLTQYFYLFFFVSIGIAYTVWIVLFNKNIRYGITYVISCAVSLGLAVISYPASLHHMLGGYRGNEAAGSLFDIGNTLMRLSFFAGLLNDFVFAGLLWMIIGTIIVLAIIGIIKYAKDKTITDENNDNSNGKSVLTADFIMLIIGTIGYFLITTKTALLVGAASNRYEMPAYGLVIIILAVTMHRLGVIWHIGDTDGDAEKKHSQKGASTIIGIALCCITVVTLHKGLFIDNRVLFIYPEDREKIAFASERHDKVAVVMFNPATPHNVWRLTDELLEYDKVYYMDEENNDPLDDVEIMNAGEIILYAADDDNQENAISNLMQYASLNEREKIYTEEMWNTYILR